VEVDVVSLASEFPNDNPALHRGVIWVCTEPTGGARPERPQLGSAGAPTALAPAKHDSLAPPEDELDDAADPILVEELEPIEASVEGDVRAAADDLEPVRPVAPAPAHSEVVLAGSRVHEDDGPVTETVTPVFDEVVAREVPSETTSLPPAPDDPFTMFVCTLADVAIGAGSPHIASLLPGLLFDGRLPQPIDGGAAEALRSAGLWDGSEVSPAFVAVTAAWRSILRGTSDDFDACGAAMLDEWAADLLARLLEAPARAPLLRQELRSRGVAAFGLAA